MKCPSCEDRNKIWIIDSGTSMHFTPNQSDVVMYQPLGDHKITVSTAADVIHVVGKGSVWIRWKDPQGVDQILTLHNFGHLPNSGVKLISMDALMNHGTKVIGNAEAIKVTYGDGAMLVQFTPGPLGPNMYIMRQLPFEKSAIKTMTSHPIDYDIMHKRLEHPSKDVLRHAHKHMHNFPPEVPTPKEDTICPGCTKVKMPNHTFSPDEQRASQSFGLIHSDLKSYSKESCHRYKYVITFLDDYTSYAWTMPLRTKNAALMVTKHFITMVQMQYKSQVKGWMSNAGGEYKSKVFDKLLLDNGIRIFQSAPHTPQQNGRAEQLMCTLNEKSESMCHDACLPDSWWEFSFAHATHIYNRMPLHWHNWRTPYKLLNKEVLDISHLRVLGCATYVFLPEDIHTNKLAPKSELMVYIGVASGNEQNYLFMCSSNNVIFTAAHALFDELHFPKCAQRTSTGPESHN